MKYGEFLYENLIIFSPSVEGRSDRLYAGMIEIFLCRVPHSGGFFKILLLDAVIYPR